MHYPVDIGRIELSVHDLGAMSSFYEGVIGLEVISSDGEEVVLGAADTPLVVLRKDLQARRSSPGEAGLFHTAFLLPTRTDLASWLRHAVARGVALTGASDHGVSEAIYLDDPEGNGIEIYVDRPVQDWVRNGDKVDMPSLRLDLDGLLKQAGAWSGIGAAGRIGHLHLATSDLAAMRRSFADWGFTETMVIDAGVWAGTGGYHHQLAANTWHSKNAGPRDFPVTGLLSYELLARPGSGLAAGTTTDADGTRVLITEA